MKKAVLSASQTSQWKKLARCVIASFWGYSDPHLIFLGTKRTVVTKKRKWISVFIFTTLRIQFKNPLFPKWYMTHISLQPDYFWTWLHLRNRTRVIYLPSWPSENLNAKIQLTLLFYKLKGLHTHTHTLCVCTYMK